MQECFPELPVAGPATSAALPPTRPLSPQEKPAATNPSLARQTSPHIAAVQHPQSCELPQESAEPLAPRGRGLPRHAAPVSQSGQPQPLTRDRMFLPASSINSVKPNTEPHRRTPIKAPASASKIGVIGANPR